MLPLCRSIQGLLSKGYWAIVETYCYICYLLCLSAGFWVWKNYKSRYWSLIFLCWVWFSFLWFLGEYSSSVLPGRKFFCDPGKCDYWWFQLNVFLGIGSWHLGMGLGWEEVAEVCTGERKEVCFTRVCLVPWEWELHFAYLFYWLKSKVPKACLLVLGARIKQWVKQKMFGEEDLCDRLHKGAEKMSTP